MCHLLSSDSGHKSRKTSCLHAEHIDLLPRSLLTRRSGTAVTLNALLQFYLLKNGSSINRELCAEPHHLNRQGEPGAVGMKWNAANWGGIYNVAIRSGDGSGRAGLMMDRRNAHGYQHDIVVDGFDVGVEMAAGSVSVVVLEYATLTNQRQAAIRISKNETFCGVNFLYGMPPWP